MKIVCSTLPIVNTASISLSWKILMNLQIWPSYLLPTPSAFHIIEYYPATLVMGAVKSQPGCVIRLKPVYQSASQLYFSNAKSNYRSDKCWWTVPHWGSQSWVIRCQTARRWAMMPVLGSRLAGDALPAHHEPRAARRGTLLAGAIHKERWWAEGYSSPSQWSQQDEEQRCLFKVKLALCFEQPQRSPFKEVIVSRAAVKKENFV